ncbi:MAG: hypothetical protein GWN86_03530, partial [Desulfobacterales bacterium]|nr:hypothetical protein [Desulfobacterales bacterium]
MIALVHFPEMTGEDINVNMMPFIYGDKDSLPEFLQPWWMTVRSCGFKDYKDKIVYLTVQESFVKEGETQRRGGIHVEAPYTGAAWGGGGNGKGLFMASSDGRTRVWDGVIKPGMCSMGGAVGVGMLKGMKSYDLDPYQLIWMTDHTPHKALPALESGRRQFFRLVSNDVSIWYSQHNTANPLGI